LREIPIFIESDTQNGTNTEKQRERKKNVPVREWLVGLRRQRSS